MVYLPRGRGQDPLCPRCGSAAAPPEGPDPTAVVCQRCGERFRAEPLSAQERAFRRVPAPLQYFAMAMGLVLFILWVLMLMARVLGGK